MSVKRGRFKAVLFDLGGTLIKTAPIPEIIGSILETYGVQKPLSKIAAAHKETDRQMRLKDYKLPYKEFWIKWNLEILKRLKIQRNRQYLARVLLEEWWDHAGVELYPDVIETLKYLSERRVKTGIVTNGFKTDIDVVLSRVGLTGNFDVEVGVDAVGKPKPNSEIFHYALERLRVAPYEAIFVGDVFETDYVGSARAGLFPVLIDREDKIKRDVRKIRRLTELRKYFQQCQREKSLA